MMEKKLIGYFKDFQLTDLIGFARMLGVPMVDGEDGFDEFVVNIVVEFSKRKFAERRGMLRLARDIAENNRDYDREHD